MCMRKLKENNSPIIKPQLNRRHTVHFPKESLKTRFREHFRKMKKPKKFDTFLYRHFKNNGHSPSKIVIQPVEKIIYDPNSSTRLKNIKRHETELKWIKFLQSPFPLGFNDNIYHEGNISKMPDFDVFSVLECKKRKSRSHGERKNGNIKRKICTEKQTLKYFSKGSFSGFN